MGFRNDLGITFKHPAPDYKTQSARAALAGIPADAPNNELTAQSLTVVERLKKIKPGQNAFTAELPDELRLKMRSKARFTVGCYLTNRPIR